MTTLIIEIVVFAILFSLAAYFFGFFDWLKKVIAPLTILSLFFAFIGFCFAVGFHLFKMIFF